MSEEKKSISVKRKDIFQATQWFEHGDHPHVEKGCFYGQIQKRLIETASIRTLHRGWQSVEPGDWIIEDELRIISVYNQRDFERMYEIVESTGGEDGKDK